MKDIDRDNIDDLFRSKLQQFEVETVPDDWEAIADRLPKRRTSLLYKQLTYWAAAAAVALLLTTGSLFLFEKNPQHDQLVQEIERQQAIEEKQIIEEKIIDDLQERMNTQTAEETTIQTPAATSVAATRPTPKAVATVLSQTNDELVEDEHPTAVETVIDEQADDGKANRVEVNKSDDETDEVEPQPLLTDEQQRWMADASVEQTPSEKPNKKWGFGVGGGSVSMNSNNVVPQYVTNSSGLRSENLTALNNLSDERSALPRTNIKHKTPITFGIGISRYLNNRWSLNSGINYSYLSSNWETNGEAHAKTEQGLHFVGIPLSLIYQIAEWNRFNFYASGGMMTEINVAGNKKTRLFVNDLDSDNTEAIPIEKENIRMKEWMWSLNLRAGVSYPLLRFLSAYAEVGANYYFDNGSAIETIRSDKPFNAGVQFGLRIGF